MKDIWIIDDHAVMRRTLAALMREAAGIRSVVSFSSAEDAHEALRAEGVEKPALVLLDIGLKGMSGLDAIPILKGFLPEACIVVLTVFEDDEKLFKAICAGASGYLLKTQSSGEILRAVGEALDGGAPVSPRLARRMMEMFAALVAPRQDYGLSSREREVLQWIVDGLLKKEIAARTGLSIHTVDAYLRRIYEKLHVQSRSGAVTKALRERLL
jgi:DNA-binding NarL/FixJ family response regulator